MTDAKQIYRNELTVRFLDATAHMIKRPVATIADAYDLIQMYNGRHWVIRRGSKVIARDLSDTNYARV